jgi:simple sugar transport system permease protein
MSGAALFGFADALQLRDSAAVHALLMLVAVAMVAFAVLNLRKKKYVTVAVGVAISILSVSLYYGIDQLPGQFVTMTPYVMTLLVLGLGTQRLRMPAADGVPYRRGGGK